MTKPDFQSFIMGGFECSTHRRVDGRRLDLISSTGHDTFAVRDYARLRDLGISGARDGLRWHLIETSPGCFDFSSAVGQIEAAETYGVDVIWDLFHYGYPDDVNVFNEDFVSRFAAFAAAFAELHVRLTGRGPRVVPVNEISFFSWIGGDVGQFAPYATGRGNELKLQLVRAAIAAAEAVRAVSSSCMIAASEPAVSVVAKPDEPWHSAAAESYRLSQFQALDILTGNLLPELGGSPDLLDIIGVNYYPHNQWFYPDREMIHLDDPLYRPMHQVLEEISQRYSRPMFISETGTEDDRRVPWFRYVYSESMKAIADGVDLRGVCLYPIVNHPGWVDDRHCHNGLWDYANENGERTIYEPLAAEIRALGRYAASATATSSAR